MPHYSLNVILAFMEGLALIVSPCILPILPIILAGSLEGGKKRPIGIVVGFILAFSLFTFFSRALVRYSGIDLILIRNLSFVLLFVLGLVMISSYLTHQFEYLTRRLMNVGSSLAHDQRGGFLGGMLFGAMIGLVWTPCAGPILAAVIVQSVLQQTTLGSFFVVLAFGIGAAIPMLLIALLGRSLLNKMGFFKKHADLMRKILGVVVILSVIYMVFIEAYPVYGINSVTNVNSDKQPIGKKLINGLDSPYPAPDFATTPEWINSKPLHISDLKGKVVLVDFWTYSCINCIRTFPYLKDWYQKYHAKGFEIVGVHSPEFEFEKNFANVSDAVNKNKLNYPVVLDNQFSTWQNYNNRYWPAHYLIDKEGNVVYQHFGEGEYDVTENNIRFLLGLGEITTLKNEMPSTSRQTPETYLGFARANNFAGPGQLIPNVVNPYSFPVELSEDQWGLEGEWQDTAQYLVSKKPNASLKIRFTSRQVFIVMGTSTGFPIHVKILLNGKDVREGKGVDVNNSTLTVDRNRLYEVLAFTKETRGTLQIIALDPGLEVYTFTFGS